LPRLRELTLTELGLTDIRPLSALTELHVLRLGGNELSDVSPLSQLPAVTTLILPANRIETVANLTLPEPPVSPEGCGGPEIDLRGNPLDPATVQHLCDQRWNVSWGLKESNWETCNSEREVRCPPLSR